MSPTRWYFHVGEASLTWDTTLTNNTTYAVRQELPPVTIDRLGVEIVTAQTSSAVRLGIYLDNEGLPDTLVYDAGTVATTSTGIREIVFPALSLDGGVYWFSATPQNSGSMPTYVAPVDVSWSKIPQTKSMTVGHQHSGTLIDQNAYTGALGTFGTPGTSTRICPRIFYRYASNDLEGFITAASNATGSLSVARPLAATASVAASASGSLNRAVTLAAAVTASASASASLATSSGPRSLVTYGSATDAASYSTTSYTPVGNRLVLAFVLSRPNDVALTPAIPTITGNGFTWVQVATVLDASGDNRGTLLRAMVASPTAGGATIDFGGQLQEFGYWSIGEIPSVNTSGTNGSGAIVRSLTNTDATVSNFALSFGSFPAAGNTLYGGIGMTNFRTVMPVTCNTIGSFGLSGQQTVYSGYNSLPPDPPDTFDYLQVDTSAPTTFVGVGVEVDLV